VWLAQNVQKMKTESRRTSSSLSSSSDISRDERDKADKVC